MSSAPAPGPIGWLFFLDIVVVICFARLVSYPLYRLKIPRIVGDIIAGCLLGPTVLQDFQMTLFPPENRPLLKLFGYCGLILASATSGAAFDRKVLHGVRVKVTIFAFLNIGITFASCFALLLFFPQGDKYYGPNYVPESYSIYFASAIAATSLPMTFLILDELKMKNSLAKFMIGSSTLGTILLFTMASIANSFAAGGSGIFGPYLALFRIGALVAIILALWLVQYVWQWALRRELHKWFWRTSTDQSILIISMCLVTAVGTERMGYTFILGAFLAGAFLPSPVLDPMGDEGNSALIRANIGKLVKYVSRWIMLPCFFLDIGLHLDLRSLGADWGWVVLALVWGTFFKFLIIPIAMFGLGMNFNDSCFAAFLANCRGFNALIIGSAALEAGQFGEVSYTIAVLFSVISSCFAGWGCQVFHAREQRRLAALEATQALDNPSEVPEPDTPALHLTVAPFFSDNTEELVGSQATLHSHGRSLVIHGVHEVSPVPHKWTKEMDCLVGAQKGTDFTAAGPILNLSPGRSNKRYSPVHLSDTDMPNSPHSTGWSFRRRGVSGRTPHPSQLIDVPPLSQPPQDEVAVARHQSFMNSPWALSATKSSECTFSNYV